MEIFIYMEESRELQNTYIKYIFFLVKFEKYDTMYDVVKFNIYNYFRPPKCDNYAVDYIASITEATCHAVRKSGLVSCPKRDRHVRSDWSFTLMNKIGDGN